MAIFVFFNRLALDLDFAGYKRKTTSNSPKTDNVDEKVADVDEKVAYVDEKVVDDVHIDDIEEHQWVDHIQSVKFYYVIFEICIYLNEVQQCLLFIH